MGTKEEQIQELLMIREHNIRQARTNLWAYSVLVSPEFYKSDRWHLYMLSEVLQRLYERKLTKDWFWEFCHSKFVPGWYADTVDWDRMEGNGKVYTSLIINMPPRHGKSRTLINFCDWLLGRSIDNRIITVSYNSDLAASMSRYVRDGIMKEKIDPIDIVYSDIFPKTKIARGNAGFMKWALEGSFFNYLGTGLEGTITGVGGNCLAGNTTVLTDKGEVTIEQICANKSKYLILSLSPFSGKIVFRRILATRRIKTNECIKFKTKFGREITCTKEHRFFDGRGFKFARDFRKGDCFYAIKKQEEQNVCDLWNGERRKGTSLPSLLSEAKEYTCKNKMRFLRKNVLQKNAGLQQSDIKKQDRKTILLKGMCQTCTKKSSRREMSYLRNGIKAREIILFQKMQSNSRAWEKKKAGRKIVSDVREKVQTDKPSNTVLLKRVRKQGSLFKNDRERKLGLQRWNELCETIQRDQENYFRKRQAYLCSLWEGRKENNNYVERERSSKNESDMPSFGQGRYKQFINEFDNSMQYVSSTYPQIERDEIVEIERISEVPQYVYDIQIEETGNFFACSLLTHNCTIIDDPIKNASEAYNDRVLDDIWAWYTGTFMSRSEQEGNGAIDIINHTRWSTKDLCGRILTAPDMKNDWFVLSLPVVYEEHILCPEILPFEKMEKLRNNMDTNIFNANYLQKPMDIEGRLFDKLKTYSELPSGTEKCIAYCDTADEGDDYLACVMGVIKEGEGFITDIYFTQDPMQVTEPETAKRLYENKVNHAKIESNNGGKGFARNVDKLIWEKYHTKQVGITWFHQTENKMARILTGSTFVMNHVYFPENWDKKWPDAYTAIMSFQKAGKNKHDDIVESIVEWGKMISGDGTINSFIEMMKDMKEGKGNR